MSESAVELKDVVAPMITEKSVISAEKQPDDALTSDQPIASEKNRQAATEIVSPRTLQEAYVRLKSSRTIPEARESAGLCCDVFLKGISIVIKLFWICITILHIYLIIVGAINIKSSCPLNTRIPIYVTVAGVLGFCRILQHCCVRLLYASDTTPLWTYLLDFMIFIWAGTGSAWVFNKEPQFEKPDNKYYCDKLTYYTGFVYIVSYFSLLFLYLILYSLVGFASLCFLCLAKVRGSADRGRSKDDQKPEVA